MSWLKWRGPVGTFTWRMLATVLAGQGVTAFLAAFAARALAAAGSTSQIRLGATGWILTAVLTLGCFLAAGMMRGPFGVTLGWVMQALTWAAALIFPAMLGVGVIFTGLWVLCLVQGERVDRRTAAAHPSEAGSDTTTAAPRVH